MYTLYYSPGAASMVVHLTLLESGLTHEMKLVDRLWFYPAEHVAHASDTVKAVARAGVVEAALRNRRPDRVGLSV